MYHLSQIYNKNSRLYLQKKSQVRYQKTQYLIIVNGGDYDVRPESFRNFPSILPQFPSVSTAHISINIYDRFVLHFMPRTSISDLDVEKT